MSLRSVLAVVPVLCLLSAPAQAATLHEAWQDAYRNNPGLAAKRAELKISDELVTMARSHWKPRINATAGIGKLYDKTPSNPMLPPTDAMTPKGVGIEVVQPIFRGFRTLNETAAAQKQAKAHYAMFQAAEQQLFLNVAATYLDIVRDQLVLDLNRHNQEVLARQYQETQRRFELGEVTRTDVLQAQSRAEGAKTGLVQAEGKLAADRAAYMRYVGMAPEILREPTVRFDPPLDLDAFVAAAVERNPLVIAATFTKDQADSEVDASMGNLLPEINLVGTATRGWEQSNFVPGRQDQARIMLHMTMPLYRAGTDTSRIRTAESQSTVKRLELEDVRLIVRQNATSAWQALMTAHAAVASDKAQVEAASLALEGVQKEAKVGTRTTLDVLNAEQELLAAKVSLVQAKRDEAVSVMHMRAAIGALTTEALRLPVGSANAE